MFQLYPKKTERLKLGLDNKTLVARLEKEEAEFNAAELIRLEAEAAEEEARDCMPAIGAFSRQSILAVAAKERDDGGPCGNVHNYRESNSWTRAEARASLAGPVGRLSIGGVGGDKASNFFSAGFGTGSSGGGAGAADPFRELSNPNHSSSYSRDSSTSSSGGHSGSSPGEAKRFSIRDSFLASHGDVEILGSHARGAANNQINTDTESGDRSGHAYAHPISERRVSSPPAGNDSKHDRSDKGRARGYNESNNIDSPQPLAFRTRRESVQDTGAKCIQAVMRGGTYRLDFFLRSAFMHACVCVCVCVCV